MHYTIKRPTKLRVERKELFRLSRTCDPKVRAASVVLSVRLLEFSKAITLLSRWQIPYMPKGVPIPNGSGVHMCPWVTISDGQPFNRTVPFSLFITQLVSDKSAGWSPSICFNTNGFLFQTKWSTAGGRWWSAASAATERRRPIGTPVAGKSQNRITPIQRFFGSNASVTDYH